MEKRLATFRIATPVSICDTSWCGTMVAPDREQLILNALEEKN
jgi:hypothetical protein